MPTSTQTMLHRIATLQPAGDMALALTWYDRHTTTVDFSAIIAQGGVFASLADPLIFAQAAIAQSGRFITFPNDIDFCADILRLAEGAVAPAES